jgi:hypothetical protein
MDADNAAPNTAPLDLEEVYANLPWAFPVNREEE